MDHEQMELLKQFCEQYESDHGGSPVVKQANTNPELLALYAAAKAYLDKNG